MKHINRTFLLLACFLLASFAVACGGGSKAGTTTPGTSSGGASGDQPPPPADERLMILFEQLSTELVTAGTDCNKYAQSVSTWTTANTTRYPQLHSEAKAANLSKDRLKLVNKRLEQSLATAVKGFNRCRNSEAAAKAFKAFDALLDPK